MDEEAKVIIDGVECCINKAIDDLIIKRINNDRKADYRHAINNLQKALGKVRTIQDRFE